MKPTSVIFLILSLLFALGGYIAVRAAESMAINEGITLVDEADETEDSHYIYDYSDDTIGKIDVNVKNTDIHIYGGSQKAYVELVNFPDGMYEFSASNRNLIVNNNSDFSKITDIASIAFNFKGLRSLINLYRASGRQRTVNIYIPEDTTVKVIELFAASGDITIESGSTMTDYNITVKSGNVDMKDIYTASAVNIQLDSGNLTMNKCTVNAFQSKVKTGNMQLLGSDFTTADMTLDSGDITLSYLWDFAYVGLDISANAGKITVNGKDYGNEYRTEQTMPSVYRIAVTSGNVTLSDNAD